MSIEQRGGQNLGLRLTHEVCQIIACLCNSLQGLRWGLLSGLEVAEFNGIVLLKGEIVRALEKSGGRLFLS